MVLKCNLLWNIWHWCFIHITMCHYGEDLCHTAQCRPYHEHYWFFKTWLQSKTLRYNTAFVKQIHISKHICIYTSWKHFCCWINVEKIMPLLPQEALSYKMSDVYFMNPIFEGSFGVDKEILVLHILLNYAYKIKPYYDVECNCTNTLPLMANIKTSNTLHKLMHYNVLHQ